MIVPHLADDLLLQDIFAAREGPQAFALWWLGQSGFLLQCQGRHLLFDPYLSDSLTRKYAHTDKPHERMTARVIAPERLNFIDVVTSSHNHTDHLDADTLCPLMQVNPKVSVVVPEANRDFVADRLGVSPGRLIGIDVHRPVEVAGFSIFGVPAAHEELARDSAGHYQYLGYVVQCAGGAIYHSGDTVTYEGMVDRLRRWPIDVALLPINGRRAERRVAGNLWGREAVQLGSAIGARVIIPCHYDMFTFNTASPDEFVTEARRVGQPVRVLECGERFCYDSNTN